MEKWEQRSEELERGVRGFGISENAYSNSCTICISLFGWRTGWHDKSVLSGIIDICIMYVSFVLSFDYEK